MKKLFALIAVTGMLFMVASNVVFAQDPEAEGAGVDATMEAAADTPVAIEEGAVTEEQEMSLHQQVKRLFIEGGATARAILDRMEWHTLNVKGEYAPGVVQMQVQEHHDQIVTIKPGSYPWPKSLLEK